jgi:short-chain fatty acids transporter
MSPFNIAVLLSAFTFLMAWLFTPTKGEYYALELLGYWEKGFFQFLAFSMQMMLILVLGHILALTTWAQRGIALLLRPCTNTAKAAALVTAATCLVALFNWGLALIFGAILARKVGEQAAAQGQSLNYPLIGAAGYSGMMVWHGGLSGSAPLAVAEPGHRFAAEMGVLAVEKTLFAWPNLLAMLLVLSLLPLWMYFLGHRYPQHTTPLPSLKTSPEAGTTLARTWAERLDNGPWTARSLGSLMVFFALYKVWILPVWVQGKGFDWSFSFVQPNYLIFLLFGLALLAQGSVNRFLGAAEEGILGATGILVQFPLYAGIMGIMTESGLVKLIADGFVGISTPLTLPLFTLFAAGLINIFVPSGGGQWLVQGPIVIATCQQMNVPIEKGVMALAYGDQLTNMLQPFWALPLLGITGLQAKEILPFSAALMLPGAVIYGLVLVVG